jgi:hypothetical protein
MPDDVSAVPPGYSPEDAARLRRQAISTSEGAAFWDQFVPSQYNPQNEVVEDEDEDGDGGGGESPAVLTDVPTSSTNVTRPRTVASGYDPDRKVLTVMFRDGTLWNYYDVSSGEWSTFHNSFSKGPMLNYWVKGSYQPGFLLYKSNGPADLASVSQNVLAEIYKVARLNQYRYAYHGYVPRTAQGRGYVAPKGRGRSSAGKNTATANKPKRLK